MTLYCNVCICRSPAEDRERQLPSEAQRAADGRRLDCENAAEVLDEPGKTVLDRPEEQGRKGSAVSEGESVSLEKALMFRLVNKEC